MTCVNSGQRGHCSEATGKEKLAGCRPAGRFVGKKTKAVMASATRMLLAGLVIVIVSGCGRYKEDLEQAKRRIDSLTADNKKCSETIAGMEKDKQQLTEARHAGEKRIETLVTELGTLKKANAALAEERDNLTRKNNKLSTDLLSLKREKSELEKQVQELKERVTRPVPSSQPPTAERREGMPPTGPKPTIPKAPESMSPCQAVLAFMKASEQAVRMNTGQQRTEMLGKIKQQYSPRMKGAPEKAIKNAEAWVDELSSAWDKTGGDVVFKLLTKRNAVLDACRLKPGEAGF